MTLAELTQLMDLAVPGKRILVVEDHLPWLARLERFWGEAGHKVVSLSGVSEIEGHLLKGSGMIGAALVDLREINAAFLDHYFLSARYNGTSLTRELLQQRPIRICGMSSDSVANAAMIREGAVTALRKADFMRLIQ